MLVPNPGFGGAQVRIGSTIRAEYSVEAQFGPESWPCCHRAPTAQWLSMAGQEAQNSSKYSITLKLSGISGYFRLPKYAVRIDESASSSIPVPSFTILPFSRT